MNTSGGSIAALVAPVLLLWGCGDGKGASAVLNTETSVEQSVPSTGAYGMLVTDPFRDGSQVVTLLIGSEQLSLSSYQGSLRFDVNKIRLLNVDVPDDDVHLVNELDADEGVVRFAGFAVDGFSTAVELRLSFACGAPIQTGDLRFDLEVLGTDVGAQVPSRDVFENQQLIPKDTR